MVVAPFLRAFLVTANCITVVCNIRYRVSMVKTVVRTPFSQTVAKCDRFFDRMTTLVRKKNEYCFSNVYD